MRRFALLLTILLLGSGVVRGEEKPSKEAKDAKPSEERIDFDKARQLFQKRNRGEKLTGDEDAYLKKAIEARRRGQGGGQPGPAPMPREQTGFKPLTEMTAEDRYKGQDGGLYGEGKNVPPDAHRAAARSQSERIQPLDRDGKPSPDGQILLISISMSNATQEYSTFKRLADADSARSPKVNVVDCAQGGQTMSAWANAGARAWSVADERIAAAGASPRQVQAAWIKPANPGPRGELEDHGRALERDTRAVLQNALARFPNLRIAYLSSRIYGGYANGPLNPEPYAYEGAFVVRWLIQAQIQGDSALNFDPEKGAVKSPLLLWGPYLWADGTKPRKIDKLVWTRDDLGPDGTHPSNSGREKVARLLLDFFKTDETAKRWFVRQE